MNRFKAKFLIIHFVVPNLIFFFTNVITKKLKIPSMLNSTVII